MLKVTFQDKTRYEVSNKLLQYHHHHHANHHHGNIDVCKRIKARRGVNFAPSEHKLVRLTSARMVFGGERDTPGGHQHRGRGDTGSTGRERAQLGGTAPGNYLLKEAAPRNQLWSSIDKTSRVESGLVFQRRFRPLGLGDGERERVRERRAFAKLPFTNPAPFDHRGWDESIPETRLRTLKTPDPFNLQHKTLSLNDSYKHSYTDPPLTYGTRNITFKFRTLKTPEPTFDPRLLIHKGHYSPAFTAHNAYLDRINKNISS